MTIEECRNILGAEAVNMSDEDVSALLADTVRAVDELYMQMKAAKAKDADAVRWTAHAFQTGEVE